MKSYPITVKDFGKKAILVEWPIEIEEGILNDIIRFKTILKNQFKEGLEFVPAYNSLTIISSNDSFDLQDFKNELPRLYSDRKITVKTNKFLWKIPVCYDNEFGIDLEEVASHLKTSITELIESHSSYEYTVYGIGFLPGFMYLGGLPKSLETKRKKTPRLKVAKGAVGLAGKQTGIYPQESPGGWNIIGNCPIPIFNVDSEKPCFVQVGDKIKFESITRAEHDLFKIEGEVGIYQPEKIALDA
ncbi:5-oxoprolinase subunit PxpB [Croceitalea sp. MTPC9]|uniref:5-oxoprolinase subunit PxpB n=1 Tax=unclassified Croceitalea TaxID=2632280 RepID=UPI002B39DA67|nr:5-oxoprolinase subunit PxpB [Croceitalea sp. MTPC6]GMN15604.1 5-oxoprolinase subunit PxpB [Croceitalea sp. MTPC9]